jgi:hypothetical protein
MATMLWSRPNRAGAKSFGVVAERVSPKVFASRGKMFFGGRIDFTTCKIKFLELIVDYERRNYFIDNCFSFAYIRIREVALF